MIAIISCEITSGNLDIGIVKNEKLNLLVPNNHDDGVEYLWCDEDQLVLKCSKKKPEAQTIASVIFKCIEKAKEDKMPLSEKLLKNLYVFIASHANDSILSMQLNFEVFDTDQDALRAIKIVE